MQCELHITCSFIYCRYLIVPRYFNLFQDSANLNIISQAPNLLQLHVVHKRQQNKICKICLLRFIPLVTFNKESTVLKNLESFKK